MFSVGSFVQEDHMTAALTYVIKYVADMDRAARFHRDSLGLALRFQSPHWTEFDTGATTLALHPATADHRAGSCQVGFRVPNIADFYTDQQAKGVQFTSPPADMHGQKVGRFRDSEGAECSVSGQ
jgi:catechol 2,3-dioxygenase-like lactoylglutathione lyase family enzyme